MVVGVPKEIKVGEQRVALTPAGARAFTEAGHRVLVEANAAEAADSATTTMLARAPW